MKKNQSIKRENPNWCKKMHSCIKHNFFKLCKRAYDFPFCPIKEVKEDAKTDF